MENEENNLLGNGEAKALEVKTEPEAKKENKLASVGELFGFSNKIDAVLMIFGTIGAILYGAIVPGQFILLGQVTDRMVDFIQCINLNCTSTPDVEATIAEISLWYVGIAFANLFTSWLCLGLWGLAAERQVHKMRMVLFRNIINQEIGWFDTNPSGELNTRLTQDLNKIADGMGGKFGRLISCLFTFVAGFGIGFYYTWKMTLVMTTLLPVVMVSGGMVAKIVGSYTANELSSYAKAGNVAEQSFSSFRTVAAFGGEEKQVEKYDEFLVEACYFGTKKGFGTGLGMGVFQLVLFLNYALSFWFGLKLVRDGEVTSGDVVTTFFAVFMGSMTLGQAGPSAEALAAARGAGFTILNLINRKSEIDPSSKEGSKPNNIEGSVEFKNICFSYPSRETTQILKDFNLVVPSGKRVALVGESGCGKSTVVKLVQRFYDPQGGSVLLDGEDIKSMNVKHLRNLIGVVNQEPVLFATTISDNISYGREGVTQQEIEEAAKMANAHDFITQFPQGYETLCGERGAQMSGGQKQRIAIARALVRNPKILLLDEATSALDTESETIVQEALDKAGKDRTTIIVAHRLSTIKDADIIVAVKEGSVAESGNHNELMDLGGIYKDLVEMQELAEEEAKRENDEDDDDDDEDNDEEKDEAENLNGVTYGSSHNISGKAGYSMESLASLATVSEVGDKPEEPPVKFTRLLKMNSPEWRPMLLGSFGALLYGAYPFLFAICFGGIFKTLSYNPNIPEENKKLEDDAKWWAAVWVLIGIESGLGCLFQYWMFAKSGERLTRRLRKQAFFAFLRQDMKYFDQPENSTGALCTRLASEVSCVQGATGSQLGLIISGIIMIVGCLIVAFINSWQISLVMLAFIPFLFLGGTLSMMTLGSKNRDSNADDPGQILEETLSNIHTVTFLSLQKKFYDKYHAAMAGQFRQAERKTNLDGLLSGISLCIINLGFGAAFRYSGKLLMDGELKINEMMTAVFAVIMGAVTVGQIYSLTPDYAKAKDAAKKLFQLLDLVPVIDSYSDGGIRPESCEGAVELTNVRFRYPTRRKVRVLRGLNITVQPGKVVALVGSSGCGKSTAVSLVERFYDARKGHLKIDGNDIKTLNLKWLRSQIGIVSQEPVLFNLTIKENIAYGDTTREVKDKEIEEAAKVANIHEFILGLPEGYDTVVGDKGTLISGGQKQRIAIARALIRDPKILLLDEATSALDTESEKVVQQALDKASIGRTTLVIAHRLSTIQNADQIVVIKKGRVVEEGTHQQLLALKGMYHTFYKAQSKSSDEE